MKYKASNGDMMREYLAKLQEEYEQIASNQIGLFDPDLSYEQFKDTCDEKVKNLKSLRVSTEKTLREHLYPTLDNIGSISDEDEAELYSTAQMLSSFETHQDPGLALKIYKALLERARKKKDDAKTLKYLYWCGITQFFFYGKESLLTSELENFREGATYADKYHTFEDPEIRQYVHRCLGNTCMCLYANGEPEKAIEMEESNFSFWNKLIFTGKDPDFPWLNYFLNGFNHRLSHLNKQTHSDPESVTNEQKSKILDATITMNKLYHKNSEYYKVFGGSRYDYHLWEAQFHSGLISFDNLIENIDKRKAEIDPDDYSQDAMYICIQLNAYLMLYASKIEKLKDRKKEIIERVSKDSIDYLASIPKTIDTDTVNVSLRSLAEVLSVVFNPGEQLDFILKMTTFRHIPTYAHSIMVGKIAKMLTKHLIEKNPACFIGCLDIEREEDVIARAEELCEFAEKSGICHDIGKIACMENPYMHIRVLTEEEFAIIKRHPKEGAAVLARDDGDTKNQGFIDVIIGHHKFHDNSGGYPEDFDIRESKHRMMIDIISAANSFVAATDRISKIYTEVKSFKEVRDEIKAEAGTRYSPDIAKILDDETVSSSIKQLLNEEVINAYYTAYLYSWGGGKQ